MTTFFAVTPLFWGVQKVRNFDNFTAGKVTFSEKVLKFLKPGLADFFAVNPLFWGVKISCTFSYFRGMIGGPQGSHFSDIRGHSHFGRLELGVRN